MGDLINGWSFLFSLVNFAIIYFVLSKFLFGRVAETLDEREARISKSLSDAERIEKEVQRVEKKAAEIIAEANRKANQIVAEYTNAAEEKTHEMKLEAEEKIAKLEKDAKMKIEAQRDEMIKKLKAETADLAILATEKIIEKELDKVQDKKIVEAYLAELK